MDPLCLCHDSGKHLFRTMARSAAQRSMPLDEILQLHQNIRLLGLGVPNCTTCSINDEVMAALLDGLATLSTLYEATRVRYTRRSSEGAVACDTHDYHANLAPLSISHAMPSATLGRMKLTDVEANLVAITLIKEGLSQSGSQLQDLQQHLTRYLTAKKIERSTYDVHLKKLGRILDNVYSSLANVTTSQLNQQ